MLVEDLREQPSLKQLCKQFHVDYRTVLKYVQKNSKLVEVSNEQIVKSYIIHKIDTSSFVYLCNQYNINPSTAYSYRRRHPELTNEQVIEYYLTPKAIPFKQLCIQYGVDWVEARDYKRRHNNKNLTNEQIIHYLLNTHKHTKKGAFSKLCKKYNIDYDKAKAYKKNNKDLTIMQVIQHFTPNSYINSQGELIVL